MKRLNLPFMLLALLAFTALTQAADQKSMEYREVTWDDLMPEGWMPPIQDEAPDVFGYHEEAVPLDTNPLEQGQKTEIAPVVQTLDKQKIKLPGYIIPIKMNGQSVSEFLLVPYVGACIHVPPPPENQMVYVTLEEPLEATELWAPVWVSGVMTTQLAFTEFATAGYHMKQAVTELYEF